MDLPNHAVSTLLLIERQYTLQSVWESLAAGGCLCTVFPKTKEHSSRCSSISWFFSLCCPCSGKEFSGERSIYLIPISYPLVVVYQNF